MRIDFTVVFLISLFAHGESNFSGQLFTNAPQLFFGLDISELAWNLLPSVKEPAVNALHFRAARKPDGGIGALSDGAPEEAAYQAHNELHRR